MDYFILVYEVNLYHSPPNRIVPLLTKALSEKNLGKSSFLTGRVARSDKNNYSKSSHHKN